MPTQDKSTPWYTVAEAAAILYLSERQVVHWVEVKLIPGRCVRGEWKVSRRWLDGYRDTAEAVHMVGVGVDQDEVITYLRHTRRRPPWETSDR